MRASNSLRDGFALRITGRWRWLAPCFVLVSVIGFFSNSAYPSEKNNTKAYRDINAIGHRVIGYQVGRGNWYSLYKEKEIGAEASASFEKSAPILHDSIAQPYLDRLAQTIAQNSDSQFPITIRVIDSDDNYAVTLSGGYQYISRGLLVQLQSEGELAAAISRGIAHTALRSATGEATRNNLMQVAALPTIFMNNTNPGRTVSLGLLEFRRKDESAADYFGIQYLYKSGYDAECFITFVRKAWTTSDPTTATAFSPFPPLPERLKALERELGEILPQRSGAITSTDDFAAFQKYLLGLTPPKPSPQLPTLIHPDRQQRN